MKWQPLTIEGSIRGFEARHKNIYFFFGTRFTAKDDLDKLFPQFTFCFLKQVHGRRVVEANSQEAVEADAHFTNKKNIALVVQTADCLPILIASKDQVLAIHAGWRGIEQNIIEASRSAILSPPEVAAIGPHIQKVSFEIGIDVARELEKLGPTARPFIFPHINPEKRWADLNVLAEKQILALSSSPIPIDFLEHDTVKDSLFHSFRRGKQTPDRQYSFVVITDHST